MNFFEEFPPTLEDINFFRKNYGEKTINEFRKDGGMAPIINGDVCYADFLLMFIKYQPTLKIVQ